MRRSLKGICKFLLLGIITILTTVLIFRQVRPPRDSNFSYNNVRGINPIAPPEKVVRNIDTGDDVVRHKSNNLDFEPNLILDRPTKLKIDWHNYKQIEEDKIRKGMFFLQKCLPYCAIEYSKKVLLDILSKVQVQHKLFN